MYVQKSHQHSLSELARLQTSSPTSLTHKGASQHTIPEILPGLLNTPSETFPFFFQHISFLCQVRIFNAAFFFIINIIIIIIGFFFTVSLKIAVRLNECFILKFGPEVRSPVAK